MTFYCDNDTCSASVDLPEVMTRPEIDIALGDLGWGYIRVPHTTQWSLLCGRCFRETHD